MVGGINIGKQRCLVDDILLSHGIPRRAYPDCLQGPEQANAFFREGLQQFSAAMSLKSFRKLGTLEILDTQNNQIKFVSAKLIASADYKRIAQDRNIKFISSKTRL